MQVWGVVNQKGGVGKTTTVTALGGLLAQQGQRVLMVDLDPQGSLSRYFDFQVDDLSNTTSDLLQLDNPNPSDISNCIRPTAEDNLSLIPGSPTLSALERKMSTAGGMGMALKRGLDQIRQHYDVVLLDSPPVLGLLMINVLAAADQLVLPSQTEPLALEGLARMIHTLGMVEKSLGHGPDFLIVPTLHDKRTRAGKDCLQTLRNDYADRLWRSAIPVDTLLREASRLHISPALISEPSRGLEAYRLLLDDLQSGSARVSEPSKPGAWMAV